MAEDKKYQKGVNPVVFIFYLVNAVILFFLCVFGVIMIILQISSSV